MSAIIISLASILSFLLLFSSPLPVFSSLCNKDDKKALLQIKASFGEAQQHYFPSSWSNNSIACCDWDGVGCLPSNGRVFSLSITESNLSGQIPPSVGDLPFLTTLTFQSLPNLVGSIPPSITKLTNLEDIFLSHNNLSGPIPSFLGNLTSLILLDLSFNRFSGKIPDSLGNSPSLVGIVLNHNSLTGTIPPSLFKKSSQDNSLLLSDNNLTGQIPRSFADVDFQKIDVSRNQLTGDASFLLGPSKWTTEQVLIDLSWNMLDFDLTAVENWNLNLGGVDLSHNLIHGSISAQITKLSMLTLFNVSYNKLCGEIPDGGLIRRFGKYAYFHNKCLCGLPLQPCK